MQVGELFHVVHVTDDLAGAERWYDEVFAPRSLFHRHQSTLDHRTASLMLIADLPIEPMEPHPGTEGERGTIGRFRARFGSRLHSLAWYCDSVGDAYERWRAHGIRVMGDGGATLDGPPTRGGIYTHPRDTFGLIELMEPRVGGHGGADVGDDLGECYDPRLLDAHDSGAWRAHPLGILGTSHVTVLVDDLERAQTVYTGALDARPFAEDHHRDRPADSVFVLVGPDTVVELARPRPGTLEAEELERNGALVSSVTFHVRDVDAAHAHLEARGCHPELHDDGAATISGADALGARYRFAPTTVPGDPRTVVR